jgi:hypothetical protein
MSIVAALRLHVKAIKLTNIGKRKEVTCEHLTATAAGT